jgi:hypothetical protein
MNVFKSLSARTKRVELRPIKHLTRDLRTFRDAKVFALRCACAMRYPRTRPLLSSQTVSMPSLLRRQAG